MQGLKPSQTPSTTKNPIAVFSKGSKDTSTNDMLAELLVQRYLSNLSAGEPQTYTLDDLYQTFATSGFDNVGQCSHGYGIIGSGGGVNFGIDIGKAILPGFAVAEIDLDLSGERASETLVIVNRQPKSTIAKPISFLTATGKLKKGKITANACAGLKASIKLNAAGHTSNMNTTAEEKKAQKEAAAAKFGQYGGMILESIAAEASATASVSLTGTYEGEYVQLRDPSPNWYNTFTDESLKDLFFNIIGYGEADAAKARISAFFTREKDTLAPLFKKLGFWETIWSAIASKTIPWDNLFTSLEDAATWLRTIENIELYDDKAAIIEDLAQIADAVKTQQQKNWFSRRFNKDGKRGVKSFAFEYFKAFGFDILLPEKGRSGHASLSAWQDAITWVKNALNLTSEKRTQLLDEIAHYRKVITYFKDEKDKQITGKSAKVNMELRSNRLTYLNLWGHDVAGSAGVKATIGASATPALSLAAAAGLSASKERKWTLYRFQQYAVPSTCTSEQISECLFTQDTKVIYGQTKLSGDAVAKVSLAGWDPIKKATGKDAEIKKDFISFNTLNYQSAHLVWQPDESSTQTHLLSGSGLRYGHSVTTQGFNSILKDEAGSEDLLRTLAYLLHVSITDLRDTFHGASGLVDSDFPAQALLIESIFVLDKDAKAAIKWVDNCEPKLDKHIKKTLHDSYITKFEADKALKADKKVHLESIRIRYRLADNIDSSLTFKLGVPIGIFTAGIQLSSASRAGASGIIDLYTHWFGRYAAKQPRPSPHPSLPATPSLHP